MDYVTIKVVNGNELFGEVQARFPGSKAYEEFCLGTQSGIRLFYTPEDKDEANNPAYYERWQLDIFETLKATLGVGYNEIVGIEIF